MDIGTWANSILKKLNWTDIALVKLCCITIGIILATLIPLLLGINIWWLVAAVVIFAIKPVYKGFIK